MNEQISSMQKQIVKFEEEMETLLEEKVKSDKEKSEVCPIDKKIFPEMIRSYIFPM